ncbi:unnamed protein product, partial [Urochloa humidicola]
HFCIWAAAAAHLLAVVERRLSGAVERWPSESGGKPLAGPGRQSWGRRAAAAAAGKDLVGSRRGSRLQSRLAWPACKLLACCGGRQAACPVLPESLSL